MMIKLDDVVLRDMIEADIENYVRWFTTETKWSEFDSPWEPVCGDEEQERKHWTAHYAAIKALPEDVLRWKFEIQWNGRHVGWVSSYRIDDDFDWLSEKDIKAGKRGHLTVGIDICEPDAWGQGIGTKSLRGFVDYFFDHGADSVYTQTWSGNVRMIRCAEKLGFLECDRRVKEREVNDKQYDGLTFRLDK